MRQILYFMREGLKILFFHRKIAFLAILVVALTLFVTGLFIMVTENLSGLEQHWRKQQRLTVYFSPEYEESERGKIESILDSTSYLVSYEYVDEATALDNFRTTFPTLDQVVDLVEENPFSASFHVILKPGHEGEIQQLRERLRKSPAVSDVQYDISWLKKLNTVVMFLRFVGLFFGLLLGVGAVITVTNVVRMATLVHEDEIKILWLVGATPSYIRGPFMMQGIFLGLGGGIVSLIMLYIAYHVILYEVKSNFTILWNFITVTFLPIPYIVTIIMAGFLCGIFGSYITLKD